MIDRAHNSRVLGLDLARAIAILLVLVAHLVHKVDFLGFYGVELFFALSGFLIGRILLDSFVDCDRWSFKHLLNFWKRRWWRTLPNYYLFIVVFAIFHSFTGGLPDLETSWAFLLFGQCIDGNDAFFSVSWSLCIEEWFYLLFPLPLLLIPVSKKWRTAFFGANVFFFVLVSIILREAFATISPGANMRGITWLRLDAIACGAMMAFFSARIALNRIKIQLLLLGSALLLISVYLIHFVADSYTASKSMGSVLLLTPLAFSLIIGALSNIKRVQLPFMEKQINSIITSISIWSYSTYLLHVPVIWFCYGLLGEIRGNLAGNIFSKLAAFCVTIALSWLVYTYYEKPMTKLRPQVLR